MFQVYTLLPALLVPLPLLIWAFAKASPKSTLTLRFPHIERLKNTFPIAIKTAKYSAFIPLFCIWLLVILALMQPERVDSLTQVQTKGYDLMLAVDISASMQAVDFSTRTKTISRLDATKEVVGKFAQDRQGDRLGLITFGEYAYLHVPLTLDTSAISKALHDTLPGMAGNATAIGDAIGTSIQTLKKRPEGSRVLILLTDGEDNASRIPPKEAAKLAKQYGIKIYTVGVGSNGPVPFPTQMGGYTMAEMPIDEELLKEIASITGGEYFAAHGLTELKSIYAKIHELEKTESNDKVHLIREPLYHYPLLGALCLLFLLTIYALFGRRLTYA